MKQKRKIGIIKYLLIVLLLAFVVYNVFWYICIYKPYTSLGEMIGEKKDGYYWHVEDKISYYVAPPSYLDTTGNLAIGPATIRDGDDAVQIIIWRNIDGTFRVGVSLETYEVKSDGTVKCDSAKFEMDEEMNLFESNESVEALLEENRDIIEEYFDLAYDKWGILGT